MNILNQRNQVMFKWYPWLVRKLSGEECTSEGKVWSEVLIGGEKGFSMSGESVQ